MAWGNLATGGVCTILNEEVRHIRFLILGQYEIKGSYFDFGIISNFRTCFIVQKAHIFLILSVAPDL